MHFGDIPVAVETDPGAAYADKPASTQDCAISGDIKFTLGARHGDGRPVHAALGETHRADFVETV
jgi:hypothetical protein